MPRVSVIVCAYNEERWLPACLQSLCSQRTPPDEILVVDNASTDRTAEVASAFPGVRVICESRQGLVRARQAGLSAATGDVLLWLDADCLAPHEWVARMRARFERHPSAVAVTGPCRFYDWHWRGRVLVGLYDWTVAPAAHALVQHVLRRAAILYGGNFGVRRSALDAIGGFDVSIEFHGEDTNLARRLVSRGRVVLAPECYLYTSARRYRAMGTGRVFRLYVRNFWSELAFGRPKDASHLDVRS
jgi:glycosyltransferase involved in cell wall biosynthesis